MDEHQPMVEERAFKVGVSLYPEHDDIVRRFAAETDRPYSNALQFIIKDWARAKRATAAPEPERAA